ncbi:facilitated trehalose transporter Tret1 isoform X3 [Hermetia illucens]|uniref:facilitated trehalose transporter Tret1 isoform X3 n=1 Tax=Hermetia illucens TaxID=343691 RepID=UPI0018CC3A69|nr:facilitated trehalose transporter Tret1 isoform X3 [Hermetia illucens]
MPNMDSSRKQPNIKFEPCPSHDPETGRAMGSEARKLPQYIAALSATGGALAAGILLGWTSPAGPRLTTDKEYDFEITSEQFSWVGAAMTLGAACVCIPIGFMIDWLGRWLTMLLLVLPFTLGWALLIWAQNVEMMYVARFILGVSGGAFCVTAPMYTGEIADKNIRGTLGSFFQLMVTVGILFIYAIGYGLNVFQMSIISGIVPLVFGVIFFFMPESPVYLVSKGRTEKAIKSIQWLRGKDYDYNSELAELQAEQDRNQANKVSLASALSRKSTIRALFISLGLMFFQQLSGINAVIFYTTDIFRNANTGIDESLSTIVVGLMQVIATLVSVMVVDRLGRRILLLASGAIMAVCTILMGVYFFLQKRNVNDVDNLGWLPILSLCLFIIMFSLGFGPVPWLMMGELFATDVKGVAGPIAGTTNWVLAFIVTKTFNNLLDGIGTAQTFWLFSGITIIGTIFVFFAVPETKGKSLGEIQKLLGEKDERTEEAKL